MDPPDDGQRDELDQTPASSYAAPVAAVVVVVAVVLVVLGVLARPAHHHDTAPRPAPSPSPVPAPTAASVSPAADIGSVLMSVLPRCTRTDHRTHVDVAMTLSNLSNYALRVVSAAPEGAGIEVTSLRLGTRPCAAAGRPEARTVPISHDSVIAMRFTVASPCPTYGEVVAVLTMDAAGRAVHANTPALADLNALHFRGC